MSGIANQHRAPLTSALAMTALQTNRRRVGDRPRPRRAAAGAVVRRPRPARDRDRQRSQARLGAVREGRMPFQETGAQELLDRVHASGRLALSERVADAAQARHIVITLGTPSFSHIEIDMRDIRSALDDLLGVLQPGHSLIAALDGRARHDRVRRRLPRQAPRLSRSARSVFVAHAARAHRRRALLRGDRHAAVHHRRRRRALRRGRRRAVRRVSTRRSCRPRRCRPSSRRSGRTSCATRTSRCRTC